MRRPMLFVAALTALLLFPAAAAAKGPSAATISGPGLSHAITIEGFGEGDSTSPLGILVDRDRLLPAGLRADSLLNDSIASDRPTRPALRREVHGPRGSDGDSTLRQVLYPYAVNGPASYMAPAQKLWGTQSVPGGWYRGTATLKSMLVKAGLPATAPAPANANRQRSHRRGGCGGGGRIRSRRSGPPLPAPPLHFALKSWEDPGSVSSDPLDLHHQGAERVIGSYLVETEDGPALFDCGPSSCLERLHSALRQRGLELQDLRHLLLSHIHLDHAGAAGVLVREHPTLQVHVSGIGAPHLADPSRLEASARRLYGDIFDTLWGELAPVPEQNIRVVGTDVLGLECFPVTRTRKPPRLLPRGRRHSLCRRCGRRPAPTRSHCPAADASAGVRPRIMESHDRRDREAEAAQPGARPLRHRGRSRAASRRTTAATRRLDRSGRRGCNGRGVQRVRSQ